MTRPRNQSKSPFTPDELEQHLSWYVLMAAAAGVGILGPSQPAEAEIVYTKAHRLIAPNTTIRLDLNHDGIKDFNFKNTFTAYNVTSYGRLFALPTRQGNQVWGHTILRQGYASALFPGVRVGAKGQFLPGSGQMASGFFSGRQNSYGFCVGPWADVTRRYLGLKFVITGAVHFGWARLNVSCSGNGGMVTALLTGYAYESVPNRSIVTGKEKSGEEKVDRSSAPSTSTDPVAIKSANLGHLAQGSIGLSGWRWKR